MIHSSPSHPPTSSSLTFDQPSNQPVCGGKQTLVPILITFNYGQVLGVADKNYTRKFARSWLCHTDTTTFYKALRNSVSLYHPFFTSAKHNLQPTSRPVQLQTTHHHWSLCPSAEQTAAEWPAQEHHFSNRVEWPTFSQIRPGRFSLLHPPSLLSIAQVAFPGRSV